jgi:hypothetical protein
MDRLDPDIHLTVQEVIDHWPRASAALQQLKTACLGCCLARFCTLADVSATYQIPIKELRGRFQEAIAESYPYQRSKS